MIKSGGVIFDFNGTLFWDSEFQERSWDEYLVRHNIKLTHAQKKEYIHGRNGKDTFEALFHRNFTNLEIEQLTEEKEIIYRAECLKYKMELAPGAEKLLAELKEKEVPIGIATASGQTNVDFFIEKFDLLKFFKIEHIIYNDGKINGKPEPDIFLKAIEQLGVDKDRTIIFEDSFSGIQAAVNCQGPSVIIVNSTEENYSEFKLPEIRHFNDFNRNLLIC